jgi:hypothetical protein
MVTHDKQAPFQMAAVTAVMSAEASASLSRVSCCRGCWPSPESPGYSGTRGLDQTVSATAVRSRQAPHGRERLAVAAGGQA